MLVETSSSQNNQGPFDLFPFEARVSSAEVSLSQLTLMSSDSKFGNIKLGFQS